MSEPIKIFGLHSLTVLDYVSKKPLKMFKLCGELNLPGAMDFSDLAGGSNPYIVASERTYSKADASVMFHQYDNDLFTYFGNTSVTADVDGDAAGAITTPVNKQGTTCYGVGGISAVAVTSGKSADLKAGLYTVVATGVAAVNVYAATDVDFDEGVNKTINDNCLITDTPITLSATAVDLADYGISITGVASMALTVGDSCTFEVDPVSIEKAEGIVGATPVQFGMFSLYCATQKTGSGSVFNFYIPKVQPAGFDVPLKEYTHGENAPKLKILYSYSENMLYKWKRWKRRHD